MISVISSMLSAKNERDLSEVRGLEVNNLKGNVSILLICMVRKKTEQKKGAYMESCFSAGQNAARH